MHSGLAFSIAASLRGNFVSPLSDRIQTAKMFSL
jgi:hypothetical protein